MLYTIYYRLYTRYYIRYTTYYMLYTIYCILYAIHYILCTIYYILYSMFYADAGAALYEQMCVTMLVNIYNADILNYMRIYINSHFSTIYIYIYICTFKRIQTRFKRVANAFRNHAPNTA